MTTNITRYGPLVTCSCIFDVEFNAEARIHIVVQVLHHCMGGHPPVEVGKPWEGSLAHLDHVEKHAGRDHVQQVLSDNPHWETVKR